ncbi:MAG TPA: HD domain-containing protein [Acholeplasmataceae bacterium]|nr:HD domain-containing protein [Acholeplasmataceae bacterium]
MKKINDFKPGDEVADLILRLNDVQLRKTASQADYATMLGYDGENILETKIWNLTEELKEILVNGNIYSCFGNMKEYQGKMQLNIKELRIPSANEYDRKSFFEFAKMDEEELRTEIMNYVLKIDNTIIKQLVMSLLEEYMDEYFIHPAAKTMHHNYISGLAYHVYSMLKLSDTYLAQYSFLNKDLVHGGIILHDLGKIIEMNAETGEYTKVGNLIGHITIASNKLYQKAVELKLDESEEFLLLQHILISHHGLLEYGSPKNPLIPEAELVFLLDYSDSRMAALEKEVTKNGVLNEELIGGYTQPIYAFDRRSFYISNIKKK